MSHDNERVKQFLQLTPLAEEPIPYIEFLMGLAKHAEHADTAHALSYRAIMEMGEENPDEEPDLDRRRFLKMYKNFGIPSLKAFKHVAGSQRFAMAVISYLRSASAKGAQAKQILIVEGGSGAGKDYFKDGIIEAVERYTETPEGRIYAVKGCPHQENPINLLRLFKREQLKDLAEATGLGDALFKMLDLACDPCQDCYAQVMGTLAKPKAEPSLSEVEVVPMRLSVRATGISEWQPGGTSTLAAALDRANRGFISLPDFFIKREPRDGETDERLILMDAVQYRRLPGLPTKEGAATPSIPLDTFILATTNRNALDGFLNDVVPDREAFTGRAVILTLPYNLVRVEEIRIYETELARYKEQVHFDPFVLKLVATLAVLSRFAVPTKGKGLVNPLDRMRVYQGENIEVKGRPATDWDTFWGTTTTIKLAGGSSGGYGFYNTAPASDAKETGPDYPVGKPIPLQMLFQFVDPQEGTAGLDMRYVLGLLSSINEIGLQNPKHKCVNSLQVLTLLRQAMARKAGQYTLTDDQRAVYERCLKWLGGSMKVEDANADMPVGLIEGELRRMLREVVLRAFSPDYEERAAELYRLYKLHAVAAFLGEGTVKDPKLGVIPVNHSLIDELDCLRLGKHPKAYLSDDEKRFRGSLEVLLGDQRERFIKEHGREKAKEFTESWETIPQLAAAIRAKLDAEVCEITEKLLTTEVLSELTEAEQERLNQANEALAGLGFCDGCRKPILEYAKRVKVWAFKA